MCHSLSQVQTLFVISRPERDCPNPTSCTASTKGKHRFSGLFTEVKPPWMGLISGWVTIWIDFQCCTRWKSITPSTSATNVVCRLSFSQSQPYFEGFLRAFRFPPSSKSTPSLIHIAVVLCSDVIHGSCSGTKRSAGYTAPSIRPR